MPTIKSVLVFATFLLATLVACPAEPPAKVTLDIAVYKPGAKGIFAVSSTIIAGPSEVVLIDAQMGRADAEVLVARIREIHKTLEAVYVSQSDPDFYFGLETIRAAFPDVRILATPQTVAAINATKAGKLAYWGPLLKENAPKTIIVPEPLAGDTLTVDGEPLRIVGLDGPTPDRTFLWIPSIRAVLGGAVIVANEHVFMADTQTQRSRDDWRKILARVEALQPAIVVPGHYHLDPDGSEPRSPDEHDGIRRRRLRSIDRVLSCAVPGGTAKQSSSCTGHLLANGHLHSPRWRGSRSLHAGTRQRGTGPRTLRSIGPRLARRAAGLGSLERSDWTGKPASAAP